MARRIQALVIVLLVLPCSAAANADEKELTARLRAECDALLRMAVQKPYGLAWPAPDGQEITIPRGAHLVSLDPLSTPSAGLVLLWAGKVLEEERYLTAAQQAARGVAASLQPNGRVPSRAVFDTRSRPRDGASTALPDRRATYAGLALMLTVVQHAKDDSLVRSAAMRAATFLTQEQTGSGAWALSIPDAGDSPARQIPLHETDYRDATLAVLHAYEVLGSVPLRKSVEAAAKQLMEMRITRSRSAAGLWQGSYSLAAQPMPVAGGGFAVDSVASRNALHTLFAVQLILGSDEAAQLVIEESANRLVTLRYGDDTWDRLYPLADGEVQKKGGGPDHGPVFHDPNAPAQPHGDFGIPPLLLSIGQVQQKGRAAYLAPLCKYLTPGEHIALSLCGLNDSPLLLTIPTTPEEAKAYAAARREEWDALDSPGVADARTRIRRIHALLIRRIVEELGGTADGRG